MKVNYAIIVRALFLAGWPGREKQFFLGGME